MKNKFLGILLSSLILVGCNSNSSSITSNNNSSNNDKPAFVTDEDLAKTEENFIIYDNKMKPNYSGGNDLADPFIYRFNGWYYLYPTTGGGFQKAFKSQDLYNWEPVSNGVCKEGYVYEYSQDPGRPKDQTPFAPEMIYYNGLFYLISSPNGNGHYIFSSDSPEGPFTAITGNIGKNIDGSFFVDDDEQVYMYGASSGAIIAYAMENDFVSFKQNDNGTDKQNLLTECRVGGWNEGPYMLQRNGDYYLTYCGAHYLSASYRVDYAFVEEDSNLMSSSSYTREDTVLIKTEDDFKGLGHSATVLAPDMDSYYIGYHNLNNDRTRNLCLSRLSFNGSMMVANSVVKDGAVGVDLPPFYTEDDSGFEKEGNFILSPEATKDNFTVEFNNIGEGKMVFSYIDADNYSYIEFLNNDITINKVENGSSSKVYTIDLINEYDTSVYHTFRLQHRDGMMNFYFDSMEKAHSIEVEFQGGKMGYLKNNTFDEIGYNAYSNVAIGSSDNEYYADTVSLANGYDEKLSYFQNGMEYYEPKKTAFVQVGNPNIVLKTEGDHATYRMYAREDGVHGINIRIPAEYLGSTYGLRVDDGEIIEKKLTSENLKYEKGDVYLNLGEVEMSAGTHNVSIYHVGDEIAFSQVRYEIANYDSEISLEFNSNVDLEDFHTYSVSKEYLQNDGLHSGDQDFQAVVSNYEFKNVTVESEISVYDMQSTGVAGIMFNVSDFSKNYSGDGDGGGNPNTFRGYRLSIQPGYVYLEFVDFNFGKTLKSKSFKYQYGQSYILTAEVNGNNITCYLDNEELFTVSNNVSNLNGKVGVIAADCDAVIKNLYVF